MRKFISSDLECIGDKVLVISWNLGADDDGRVAVSDAILEVVPDGDTVRAGNVEVIGGGGHGEELESVEART